MYAQGDIAVVSLPLPSSAKKYFQYVFVNHPLPLCIFQSSLTNGRTQFLYMYVYIIKYPCTCVISRLINTILNVSTCTHTHTYTHPQKPTTTHSSPFALDIATLTPICCYCLFFACGKNSSSANTEKVKLLLNFIFYNEKLQAAL